MTGDTPKLSQVAPGWWPATVPGPAGWLLLYLVSAVARLGTLSYFFGKPFVSDLERTKDV